jgi:hypothetical protein
MNWITSFFLRAKHWQIFLLFFGMMLLAQIAMFNSMQSATTQDFGKSLLPFWGLTLLFALCFNGWLWAMGSFLNAIVQPSLRPGVGFFRFALIYPILYMPVFMISFPQQPAMFAVIFPLHLFAMFCMFYLLNFVSKNLVLAETDRVVKFYDYAGPFFLLWFFPIGMWTVQPRINRLYAERKKGEELSGVTAS